MDAHARFKATLGEADKEYQVMLIPMIANLCQIYDSNKILLHEERSSLRIDILNMHVDLSFLWGLFLEKYTALENKLYGNDVCTVL